MKQPPQSARQTIPLDQEAVRKALRKRHKADHFGYFATDPDPDIRTLGRLALRRDDINDLFVLGDLCARHSLTQDHRLLVFYVGKALIAYRKAAECAQNDEDQHLALHLIRTFIDWVIACARENPFPRNVAVALWALSEDETALPLDSLTLQEFMQAYDYNSESTIEMDTTETTRVGMPQMPYTSMASNSVATMVDDLEDYQYDSLIADSEDSVSMETRVEPARREQPTSVEQENFSLDAAPMLRTRAEEAEDEFQVGERIEGRYEVADIRRGGMGIVYLCYDLEQHEPVAIKTFQSRFLNNERAVNRFNNEAVTWVKLEKHRHVVQARLVQNINERPHIFLEHISGEEGYSPDLRSWIDHNRLDLAQSIEFGLHIALGMQHATRKVPGLVHRDLKPANILVTHDAIAKVTDFGLVRSLELEDIPIASDATPEPSSRPRRNTAPLTRVGAIVGTAPYMSPEQCNSKPVDLRSDIYSFGCLLFEMLTGRHVFDARRFREWLAAHSKWPPRFRAEELDSIPEALRRLTLFCLEKDANDRPSDWGVIVDTLAPIYEEVTGQPAILEVTGPALEARELMDKGYSLTELGRLDEALDAYDQAIALKPDYAWAWARRGRTLRVLGHYEEALDCYDQALNIQPRYAFAWNGKGIVMERMERMDEALACYEQAAEINPADVWHWCNQADVLLHMERFNEAVPLLEKALQLDPVHPNSWAKLGQVYRLLQDYPKSIQRLRAGHPAGPGVWLGAQWLWPVAQAQRPA